MKKLWILGLCLFILTACLPKIAPASTPTAARTLPTALPPLAPTATPRPTSTQAETQIADGTCDLPPVIAPTMPAVIPQTASLDHATNLHMTGKPQVIDLASYRLKVSGKVDHPLSLSYDELRCMPKITSAPVLVCPGVFTDHATWSGVPLKDVLERAGVQAGAKNMIMKAADDYEVTMPLETALDAKNYLAYEWEGHPLPVLHGFPLRAVFPDQPGGKWVKWLLEIVVK